jgi:uncharacterized repeat protein (TIGR03803 family)
MLLMRWFSIEMKTLFSIFPVLTSSNRPALIADDAGNLYGTAYFRGAGCPPYGCGTVFEITKSGKGKLLHRFSGPDGKNPVGSVAVDASGNVYGVTEFGGSGNTGAAYRLDPNGAETLLYSFLDEGDGGFPKSGPILDHAANLYLATGEGGYGRAGTIFEIDHTGMPSVLYTFCPTGDCLDGAYPWGSLLLDSAGNLYGTTQQGGEFGAGVVFMLDTNSVLSVLHAFNMSTDGGFPTGALARDAAGNFYGTTIDGGTHGYWTVYKLTPN